MQLVLLAASLLVLACHVCHYGFTAAVPGYLDFDNLPDTNFSCEGKVIGGYYADIETGCQMFHVCTIGQKGEITDIKFLCLNGTVFDQETRVCERVDEVDCSKTEGFYGLNLELYGNNGATYGIGEESEEEHEEPQGHHSQIQNTGGSGSGIATNAPTSTTTPRTTTTATTVLSTTHSLPSSTTPVPPPLASSHPFTPSTTPPPGASSVRPFGQNRHTVHFSSSPAPPPPISPFLTFPSAADQLFETAPEGSGQQPEAPGDHFPPPSSSSNSWPQVNLQSGGGSGIIDQTDSSPFHSLKTTPKPISLFSSNVQTNDQHHHHFVFSTTKAPSHFFTTKTPSSFSVTSRPPVTQFPLKHQGHLVPAPQFYREQQNRNRQSQQSYLSQQNNFHLVPNPLHFQFSNRPSHQHQIFTTPSVQSTVVSSTSSVSSVKTTIKNTGNQQHTQHNPTNVNSFAYGINRGLSSAAHSADKPAHNDTEPTSVDGEDQPLATPPTSYDEYHERDVHLDPFFKDVPRISTKQGRTSRRKRQSDINVQSRTRGSRRFQNAQESVLQPVNRESFRLQYDNTEKILKSTPKTPITLSPALTSQNISPRQVGPISELSKTTPPVQRAHSQSSAGLNNRGRGRLSQHKPEAMEESPVSTTREPIPETSFTCNNKVIGGYYADPEANCQLFHICVQSRHGKLRDDKFLCGPGTKFDQKSRTCQAAHLVDCSLATSLYYVNSQYPFAVDNEPVPDSTFESHKIIKRATRKGILVNKNEDLLDEQPPQTNFNCDDKNQEGLFADIETKCRYFHLCQKGNKGQLYLVTTFVCPVGTAFNQQEGNCDAIENIDCELYSQPQHTLAHSKSHHTRNIQHAKLKKKHTPLIKEFSLHRKKRNVNRQENGDDKIKYFHSEEILPQYSSSSQQVSEEINQTQPDIYNIAENNSTEVMEKKNYKSSETFLPAEESEGSTREKEDDDDDDDEEETLSEEYIDEYSFNSNDDTSFQWEEKGSNEGHFNISQNGDLEETLPEKSTEEINNNQTSCDNSNEECIGIYKYGSSSKEIKPEKHSDVTVDYNDDINNDGESYEYQDKQIKMAKTYFNSVNNTNKFISENRTENHFEIQTVPISSQKHTSLNEDLISAEPIFTTPLTKGVFLNIYNEKTNVYPENQDFTQNPVEDLKVKVSSLLIKLNASSEDLRSISTNFTNDYYYYDDDDYVTGDNDDEGDSLIKLEEMKEKIKASEKLLNQFHKSNESENPSKTEKQKEITELHAISHDNRATVSPNTTYLNENYITTQDYSDVNHTLTLYYPEDDGVDLDNVTPTQAYDIENPETISDLQEEHTKPLNEVVTANPGIEFNDSIKRNNKEIFPASTISKTEDPNTDLSTDFKNIFTTERVTPVRVSIPIVDPEHFQSHSTSERAFTPSGGKNASNKNYNNFEKTAHVMGELTTIIINNTSNESTSVSLTTVPSTSLLHLYRTWRTTTPQSPVSIRPQGTLKFPRPSIRHRPNRNRSSGQSRTDKNNTQLEESIIEENDNSQTTASKFHKPLQNSPVTSLDSGATEKLTSTITESFVFNSVSKDKVSSSTHSVMESRTLDSNGMTPSPVLPTFSRKRFFIERKSYDGTKSDSSITTAVTPLLQDSVQSSSISKLEATANDKTKLFSSLEIQVTTPRSHNDNQQDYGPFTCIGKELYVYLPDPDDCHLFHYCSPGFHSRQVLDFRFMCDSATSFNPETHHCEPENKSLCSIKHS